MTTDARYRLDSNFRRTKSIEDMPRPPLTWHRVQIPAHGSQFTYRTRDGQLETALRGTVAELDSEVLRTAIRRGAVLVPQ